MRPLPGSDWGTRGADIANRDLASLQLALAKFVKEDVPTPTVDFSYARDSLSSQRTKTGGSLLALLATVSGIDASRIPSLDEGRMSERAIGDKMTAMMDARLGNLEEERKKRFELEKHLEQLKEAQEFEVKKQLQEIMGRREGEIAKRLEEIVSRRIAEAVEKLDAKVTQRQRSWRENEVVVREAAQKTYFEGLKTTVHGWIVERLYPAAVQQMFHKMAYGEAHRLAHTVFEQKLLEMEQRFSDNNPNSYEPNDSAFVPPLPAGSSHPFDPPHASTSHPTPHPSPSSRYPSASRSRRSSSRSSPSSTQQRLPRIPTSPSSRPSLSHPLSQHSCLSRRSGRAGRWRCRTRHSRLRPRSQGPDSYEAVHHGLSDPAHLRRRPCRRRPRRAGSEAGRGGDSGACGCGRNGDE